MGHTQSFPRRGVLKMLAAGAMSAGLAGRLKSQVINAEKKPQWHDDVLKYLQSLARQDGGYGWDDQPESHLTPTLCVVGCYHLLGREVPAGKRVADFVRTHHPQRGKRKPETELHVFEYQQIQSLLWLGADASELAPGIRSWTKPTAYPKNYEMSGHPVFENEIVAIIGRDLLGMKMDDLAPAFIAYVESRQRPNGTFNNVPALEGGDGHVIPTWWGLRALKAMNRHIAHVDEAIAWLTQCQMSNGGFMSAVKPPVGGIEQVTYTWAAVRALALLGGAMQWPGRAFDFIFRCWSAEGGFGERPSCPSNPLTTFYAVDALAAMGKINAEPDRPKPAVAMGRRIDPALKVFTIQIEAPGKGSPTDAVELARSLGIHLWGAKNASPAWLKAAQDVAERRKVPVTFFPANEEYGTWITASGMGTYSHGSDTIAPAGADIGPSLAGKGPLTFRQFQNRRWAPLNAAGGRLVWQYNESEPFTMAMMDASALQGGYTAIATHHFGNPDFIANQPFLYRYRHSMPMISLQDAHADESWWWADQLTGFRTLFLAHEPTWEGWLEAMKLNHVAAVRRDPLTEGRVRMYGGVTGLREFLQQREEQWRWWDNSPRIERPMLSSAVLGPADVFEWSKPQSGLAVRIRLAATNTLKGIPNAPLAKLIAVKLDGRPIEVKEAQKKSPNGALLDRCMIADLGDLTAGRHVLEANAQCLADGRAHAQKIEFEAT